MFDISYPTDEKCKMYVVSKQVNRKIVPIIQEPSLTLVASHQVLTHILSPSPLNQSVSILFLPQSIYMAFPSRYIIRNILCRDS